jgi:hypothetical protein
MDRKRFPIRIEKGGGNSHLETGTEPQQTREGTVLLHSQAVYSRS